MLNMIAMSRLTFFVKSMLAEGTLAACDESGFDQRDSLPVYGYAPRSKPAILVIPASKMNSLILAANMRGQTHSMLHTGSVNGFRFADFITNLPFPRGTVLLLDNRDRAPPNAR